jgi:zona occludens toxin
MPIKIHHGAPGSYKTSGAVWDDLVPMCKSGRTIITNVRGFTEERCRQNYRDIYAEELPDSFEVVCIDTTTPEGKDHFCHWFEWAPRGAFFFIDEVQNIFPRKSKFFDSLSSVVPDRPQNWLEAWTMHRHWNWDFVLTLQSLSQLRDEIREVAEACYKHRNNKLIGISGRYTEGFHLPDTAGTSPSHFLNVRVRKINKHAFKFYDSTTTGIATDTYAGTPLWKNPRVILLLVCLTGALGFAFRNGAVNPLPGANHGKAGQVASSSGVAPIGSVSPYPVGIGQSDSNFSLIPYWKKYIRLSLVWPRSGFVQRFYQVADEDGHVLDVPESSLMAAGYSVEVIDDCIVRLAFKTSSRLVDCFPFPFSNVSTLHQKADK